MVSVGAEKSVIQEALYTVWFKAYLLTKNPKVSLIMNKSYFKLYPHTPNKQSFRGASEYQRDRGLWYSLTKNTVSLVAFRYSPHR